MGRYAVFAFSLFAYAVGLGGLTFFLLFVGGWSFLPASVDSGHAAALPQAIVVNLALIGLFAVQHSVMARRGFKQRLLRVLPAAAERSLYVLLSGVALATLCALWQQMDAPVWDVTWQPARRLLVALYAAGWTLAVASSFAINHFELFGVAQAYRNLHGEREPRPHFVERLFYRFVRHPLQTGCVVGLWATPTMTAGHLLLAAVMTTYIVGALQLEERDLATELGESYADYRRRVPMLIPRLRPSREPAAADPALGV